ncbi:PREDICTED: uncharacterized protein LOC102030214 [Chinchilla lanigera]|uniref:uncharacterized protein LOC102030214 n=1 Tax=Chinchilla lanigera TaxID=34839 RepID=UPI00038ECB33|nr:PREDICTED: uncharacterized protein LOC102030214 [Chinchilla lanigera]
MRQEARRQDAVWPRSAHHPCCSDVKQRLRRRSQPRREEGAAAALCWLTRRKPAGQSSPEEGRGQQTTRHLHFCKAFTSHLCLAAGEGTEVQAAGGERPGSGNTWGPRGGRANWEGPEEHRDNRRAVSEQCGTCAADGLHLGMGPGEAHGTIWEMAAGAARRTGHRTSTDAGPSQPEGGLGKEPHTVELGAGHQEGNGATWTSRLAGWG